MFPMFIVVCPFFRSHLTMLWSVLASVLCRVICSNGCSPKNITVAKNNFSASVVVYERKIINKTAQSLPHKCRSDDHRRDMLTDWLLGPVETQCFDVSQF